MILQICVEYDIDIFFKSYVVYSMFVKGASLWV